MSTNAERNHPAPASWATLLEEAVSRPGLMLEAYRHFHNYSIGNQLLALLQCYGRGLTPGPLATFARWKELGRFVQKGEKAIVLCVPITGRRTEKMQAEDGTEEEITHTYARFTYKPHWFVLSQTVGADYTPEPLPTWDEQRALTALNVTRENFQALNGNHQGYAKPGRIIAINPLAQLPSKTLFHELAHVVLGHTEEGTLSDDETTPRHVREVEAEAVALLCLEAVELPGSEYCRGYIQHWKGQLPIDERLAQRVLRAANQILQAGREEA